MRAPRISDVVNTGQLVGDKVDVEDLLGKDFLCKSVTFRPGQGGRDFAIVQGYHDNEEGDISEDQAFWFVCGGQNIVDALRKAEQSLPLLCRIEKVVSKKGRQVYTIV